MDTISLILEPDADGNLLLPVPAPLRHGKVRVVATMSPAGADDEDRAARTRAVAALERIARRGGVPAIPDPARWQRELRRDRVLPDRDA